MNNCASKRILLAEGDERVRNLTARQLREWGHGVAVATDAQQAIRLLTRDEAFDQLIIGYQLPVMNALELLSCLRQAKFLPSAVRVLIMSGGPEVEEIAERARKLGAEFLRQPYESWELRSSISQAAIVASA